MVAGLSRKKKSQAAYVDPFSEALAEFQAASRALAEAIDRDAASFESVMAAYKLPKETSNKSSAARPRFSRRCTAPPNVPLEVARKAAEIFDRLGQLERMSSPSMNSDIRVGRLMAAAAVRGALENVAINLGIDHRQRICRYACVWSLRLWRRAWLKVRYSSWPLVLRFEDASKMN